MKLFIAFHLADSMRDAVAGIQREFFERVERVEWVRGAGSNERDTGARPGKNESVTGAREAMAILRPVPPEKMHVTAVFIGEVDRETADWIGTVFHDCVASLRGVGSDATGSGGGAPARRNRGNGVAAKSGGTSYPPSLSVGGVGAFPSVRRPRVVWVGAADPHGVADRWVRELRGALRGGGVTESAGKDRGGAAREDAGATGADTGAAREDAGAAGEDTGATRDDIGATGAAAPPLVIDSRPFVPHVTIAYPRRGLNRDQRRALERALTPGAGGDVAGNRFSRPNGGTSDPVPVPRIAVVESIPTAQGTRYEDLFWIDL